MSFEKKEVTLKLDKELYKAVEEYCAYSGDDEEKVIHFIVNRSLKKFNIEYEKLKKGYVEMGNIMHSKFQNKKPWIILRIKLIF